MATLDIPLRGMTVVEICRAYPEQVAAAIERHNSEVAPSASANIAMDAIAELAEKFISSNKCDESISIALRCFAEYVRQRHQ
jgi:hypothetical protein